MANNFLVSRILLLFHSPKGSWNKSAKYEKFGKYWPYCTRNRAITNAYWWYFEILLWSFIYFRSVCVDHLHRGSLFKGQFKKTLWKRYISSCVLVLLFTFYYFCTSLFSRNSLVEKTFGLKLPGNMLKPPLKLLNLPQFRPDHKKIVNPRLTHPFPMHPFSTPWKH